MKIVEPLEDLKKDLGEMIEDMGWDATFHSRNNAEESSFLMIMEKRKGYVFRVNKQGGLDITYPLTVDPSTKTHSEVIKMAKEYYPEIKTSQIGIDIIALNHFYQS